MKRIHSLPVSWVPRGAGRTLPFLYNSKQTSPFAVTPTQAALRHTISWILDDAVRDQGLSRRPFRQTKTNGHSWQHPGTNVYLVTTYLLHESVVADSNRTPVVVSQQQP
jgi:hypothetical protein